MKPKFKGTPGPWKICCYGHEYKELVIEKDKKPETRVANVAIQEIFESLANARLIAAAPELLEALQKTNDLLKDLDCQEGPFGTAGADGGSSVLSEPVS